MVKVENVSYSIGNKKILDKVDLVFQPGEFNIILGPNGSGKSSLMKIFSGLQTPTGGSVKIGSADVHSIKKNELARYRAVLTQQPEISFPVSVEEVVMMGRYPHFEFAASKNDLDVCSQVIKKLNLGDFRNRNYLSLSGGEKQRVHFARVLAQVWEKPASGFHYLFLDEPLASLDIRYQQEFLGIARDLLHANFIIVAILHDINQSIQFGDKLFFMREGKLLRSGTPSGVISQELIKEVYDVTAQIISNPETGSPLVIFS